MPGKCCRERYSRKQQHHGAVLQQSVPAVARVHSDEATEGAPSPPVEAIATSAGLFDLLFIVEQAHERIVCPGWSKSKK